MTPTAPAASVTERLEEAVERETPHWGIRPVPDALRRFSGLDLAVLWGDLSIGLLVLVSGALLVPVLALAGPRFTVRRWLERCGVWLVVAVAVWITVKVLAEADLHASWSRPGVGGLRFWLGVDLVLAMPISWLPLVAD